MIDFKEWLVIDRVRTDIYEGIINELRFRECLNYLVEFTNEALNYPILENEENEDDGPAVLDDPFADGDENAAPVSVDPSQSKFIRKTIKQSKDKKQKKEKISKETVLSHRTPLIVSLIEEYGNLKIPLKNAIVWIRWSGILDRIEKIEELKKIKEGVDKIQGDGFSVRNQKDKLLKQAKPYLKSLGYIDNYKDEHSDSRLGELLSAAVEEKGNELPSGVSKEEIKSKIDEQKKIFFEILNYKFKLKSIKMASVSSGYVDGKRGYANFPEEILNNFMLRYYDSFAKRQWYRPTAKAPGHVGDWTMPFGTERGKLASSVADLEDDSTSGHVLNYSISAMGSETYKSEREKRTHLPPTSIRGSSDPFLEKIDDKKRLIKKDIESNNLDFYLQYLKDSSQYEGKTLAGKDALRLQIIQHIEYLRSKMPSILSLDPQKIIDTLKNYVRYGLKSSDRRVTFLGTLSNRDKDEEGSFEASDDDSMKPRKVRRQFGSVGGAQGAQQRTLFYDSLKSAFEQLKTSDPMSAFAMCIAWQLDCQIDPTGKHVLISSYEDFSNAKMTDQKIGLSAREVKEIMDTKLPVEKQISQAQVNILMNKGRAFIMNHIKANLVH